MADIEKRYSVTGSAVLRVLSRMYEKATADGKGVFIAIVDGSGSLTGMIAHERVPAICRKIAQEKAYTAFAARMKTSAWKSYVYGAPDEERHLMLSQPGYIAASGGAPILIEGIAAGGIGVSGASQDYDDALAEFGASLIEAA